MAGRKLQRTEQGDLVTSKNMGDVHSDGDTPKMESLFHGNPNLKWMTTGGTPMTQDTSIWNNDPNLWDPK